MTQRIDSRMHLRSLAALGSIVTAAGSRLGRRLQRAAIKDHGRRLAVAPCKLTQQNAQIIDHNLEAPRIDPPPHLLVNHLPWRQVVRHKAPLAACLGDIAKPVEYIPKGIIPLRRILAA